MVNEVMFQNSFELLWGRIADNPEQPEGLISFHDPNGLIHKMEGYKQQVRELAYQCIQAIDWQKTNLIGSKEILKAVSKAFFVKMDETTVQNLVDYRDVDPFLTRAEQNLRKAEQALYDIFQTDDDEKSFNEALAVWKDKYALISYLFFIKDPEKYAVMRPQNFANRLAKLGVSGICTAKCTWRNYRCFLDILNEVRSLLEVRLDEAVSLLDAHSFVWMLWMINETIVPREPMTNLPDHCDSMQIVKGASGKQIIYHSSWEIINQNKVIKHCDKSFFISHGVVIPKTILAFFNAESLSMGEKKEIPLQYDSAMYRACLSVDKLNMVRLILNSDFAERVLPFGTIEPAPIMLFSKLGDDSYSLEILVGSDRNEYVPNDDNSDEIIIPQLTDEALMVTAKRRGKKDVESREVTSVQRVRDAYIAEYAKRRADGRCQLCRQEAPFRDVHNKPYLEAHHIVWLSNGGEDTIDNVVALCPNCHRQMHVLNRQSDIEKLQKAVSSIA